MTIRRSILIGKSVKLATAQRKTSYKISSFYKPSQGNFYVKNN